MNYDDQLDKEGWICDAFESEFFYTCKSCDNDIEEIIYNHYLDKDDPCGYEAGNMVINFRKYVAIIQAELPKEPIEEIYDSFDFYTIDSEDDLKLYAKEYISENM